MVNTKEIVRRISYLGVLGIFIYLFMINIFNGHLFQVTEPQMGYFMQGWILVIASLIIFIESVFRNRLSFADLKPMNTPSFVMGVISGFITFFLGLGFILNSISTTIPIVSSGMTYFSSFLGGIYLNVIVILVLEGGRSLFFLE